MPDHIKVTATISAPSSRVYSAWLNSKEHSAMTGAKATASAKLGGRFSAWDKYISGKNIELVKNKRITQTWRGTDFPSAAIDSILIINFEDVKVGTKITLTHTELPKGTVRVI